MKTLTLQSKSDKLFQRLKYVVLVRVSDDTGDVCFERSRSKTFHNLVFINTYADLFLFCNETRFLKVFDTLFYNISVDLMYCV